MSGLFLLHHLLLFGFGIFMSYWIYDGYMNCFDLELLFLSSYSVYASLEAVFVLF